MKQGRTIVITGTSRGIGKALAQYYLGRGNLVVGCSRGPATINHEAYDHFELNVSDEGDIIRMVQKTKERGHAVDALINNAGIAAMNHALLTPLNTFKDIFNVNVTGTFLFCREMSKLMIETGGGRIVNMVSVADPLRLEGEAVYAASKAAVLSFTRILAKELAPYNITVNAVGPTPINTTLIKGLEKEKLEKVVQAQPLKRMGTWQDVAHAIDFFLHPKSTFISAQVIYLGGVS